MPFREENWDEEQEGYCRCFFVEPIYALDGGLWPAAYAWCEAQFGLGHELGPLSDFEGVRWFYVHNIMFGFRDQDRAFAFKMRWGGAATDD